MSTEKEQNIYKEFWLSRINSLLPLFETRSPENYDGHDLLQGKDDPPTFFSHRLGLQVCTIMSGFCKAGVEPRPFSARQCHDQLSYISAPQLNSFRNVNSFRIQSPSNSGGFLPFGKLTWDILETKSTFLPAPNTCVLLKDAHGARQWGETQGFSSPTWHIMCY